VDGAQPKIISKVAIYSFRMLMNLDQAPPGNALNVIDSSQTLDRQTAQHYHQTLQEPAS
jgi:hypothetical protein